MSSPGSITQWIDHLRAGDQAAAQRLWEHYTRQLRKLNRIRALWEEEVAP